MKPSERSTQELLLESVLRLDVWLEANGWAGFDPYDIKGTKTYLWLVNQGSDGPLLLRLIRKILIFFESHFPVLIRQFLGVKKHINPKGMGLFARGYLDLYQGTGDGKFKEKALECLNWLQENYSQGYSGYCWGYTFDWQSKVLIPKGTPSAVVSSVVGDAFWRAYEVLGDQHYLKVCESICEFFLADLNRDEVEDGIVCFSYTPVDDFHVHNANLFVAEFLIRVGVKLDNAAYQEWGKRAAAYALSEQNPDGSLFYWGKVQNQNSPNHIDHYHSGFEIRSLYKIWKWTGDPRFLEGVERYYSFYLENLISRNQEGTLPKMKPDAFYPIDIHSCAEALLCNATLADKFEEAQTLLLTLSVRIIPMMQTQAGWFIYRIYGGKGHERRAAIPYMRWGQAWMLNALSFAYLQLAGESD